MGGRLDHLGLYMCTLMMFAQQNYLKRHIPIIREHMTAVEFFMKHCLTHATARTMCYVIGIHLNDVFKNGTSSQ